MKNLKPFTLSLLMVLSAYQTWSQSHQLLRGTVIDNITESPIPGAKVLLTDLEPMQRVLTDVDGNFRFDQVPLGRHTLVISYSGYKDALLANISITAGKESVLEVRLEEDIHTVEEVKVVAKKDEPINEMSVVSNRSFSVEETQKYAAAMNDPARMATSFAGVVSTQDINNDISIRGNAPRGILWRMEGMEIPNPNHFSGVGTSGGGISIISAQLLGNSEFSTGAFAAEYGNALSGIFDLSLRKGNNERREYTVQAGVLGLDAAMEGPFKKGYAGSYLINYRYSTLGILRYIVPLGDAVTNFQDLSFNVYLPTKKIGNFGVFGFGGLSDDTYRAEEDTALWSVDHSKQYEGVFLANTGMVGAWHKVRIGANGFLKTNASISATRNGYYDDSLDMQFNHHRLYYEAYIQKRISFSTNYVHKLSAKTNIRSGVIFNVLGFNLRHEERALGIMQVSLNDVGVSQSGQAYCQLSHKFTDKLTVNGGLHYLHFFLNNTQSVEPRASISYQPVMRHNLGFGYGLHGQIQPIGTYFARSVDDNGKEYRPNHDLAMSKAHHFVLSYKWNLDDAHLFRTEVYYQHLFNVPISADQEGTFSLLNSEYGYEYYALNTKGLGRNYGLELSFERSLKKGLYYLLTVSLSESKYKAQNGQWYNTRFNTNYAFNLTAGKDWTLRNTEKHRVFGVNLKSVCVGGMRVTPFDTAAINAGTPELDYARSYETQLPVFYRLDLRLSLKRDYKRITSTVSLDIQNVLNRKNVGGHYFDTKEGVIKYWYSTGLLPFLSYRINF